MSCDWEGQVKINSANLLQVRLGAHGLSDDQICDLATYLEKMFKSGDWKPGSVWANIDLSENSVGDKGLVALLSVLERNAIQVKCLKLYKNRIGDEGGLRLVQLISEQMEPMEEVHLSHNALTGVTLVSLCLAIHRHKYQAYPLRGKQGAYIPIWVRMEYNSISNSTLCVDLLRKEAVVPICLAENRADCGPWRCAHMSNQQKGVPAVHIFSIANQGRSFGRPPAPGESESALRDLIWKTTGGSAKAASEAKPTAPANGKCAETSPTAVWSKVAGAPRPGNSGVPPPKNVPQQAGKVLPPPKSGGYGSYPKPAPEQAQELSRAATAPASANNGEISIPGRGLQDKESGNKKTIVENQKLIDVTPPLPKAKSAGVTDGKENAKGHVAGDDHQSVANNDKLDVGPAAQSAQVCEPCQIYPQQLTVANDAFLCPICKFITPNPFITICSHIFCTSCFDKHVKEVKKDSKQSGVTIAEIPCPQPQCDKKLARKDVTSLDAPAQSAAAAVHAILKRLASNQQVRCRHHKDLYKEPFGLSAAAVKAVVKCDYVGDLMSIQQHQESACPVQKHLDELAESKGKKDETCKNRPAENGKSKKATKDETDKKSKGSENHSSQPDSEEEQELECQMARCIHDFHPTGENQLELLAGDLLLIYDTSDSGWAAGQKLNSETQQRIGSAGWFPEGYLQRI